MLNNRGLGAMKLTPSSSLARSPAVPVVDHDDLQWSNQLDDADEQVAWVDAMAWQLTSSEKGLRREQYKTVLQSLFEHTTHQLAFRRSKEHGGNIIGTLVEGGPMLRTDTNHAEFWEFSWDGRVADTCGSTRSNWVASHSVAQCR